MGIPGLQVQNDSEIPVYRQIADGILEAAADGRLPAGARLPATRDLARQLGVNRNTVVAAYDQLAREQRVHGHTGRGTFLVSEPAPRKDTDEAWFTGFSRAVDGAEGSGLQSILRLACSPEGTSFVGSYPAAELMPVKSFARAMQSALDQCGARVLGYGPTAGHAPLRDEIARRMRSGGSDVSAANLLVTNGAQQAIELVFRSFLERGDSAIIEEPTYTGALTVLRSLGARVVGIPLDEEGMRPDLLAAALEHHRPRLIYLQPTFQNPTARVMGEARRREILAVAARHRCPIVEDDWAGDLRLEGDPLPTLHALDGGSHVIYLSTFSKKLMPGLRLGWCAAPRPVIERLVELKRLQDCGSSPLLQAALDVFLREGSLEQHLERIRPAYRERRDAMLTALERHFPAQVHWERAAGGLFLWIRLPRDFDGNELFVAARQHGVLYSRGELFHSNGSGRNTFRLTYSGASPEKIEQGVAVLGQLVKERLDRADLSGPTATEAMPIL